MPIATGEPIDFGETSEAPKESLAETLTTAAATPAETATPPETPAPETTETPAEPAEPAAPETNDERIVLEAARDLYGKDFTTKYQTDEEFFKGIVNLQQKLHEREEIAEYGRRVMQQYGDVFQRQQQAQPPAPQPAQPQQPFEGIPSREQIKLWQQQVRRNAETGEMEAMPGAEPNVLQKLDYATERMTQAIHALAFQPDQFLQERITPLIQGVLQQTQQYTAQELAARDAQQRNVQDAISWVGGQASWMCVNGKDPTGGLTPLGERFTNTFDTMQLGGMPLSQRVAQGHIGLAEAMNIALGELQRTMPRPTPVQPPRQQATHVPNVATMPVAETNEYDQREGENERQHLTRVLSALMGQP